MSKIMTNDQTLFLLKGLIQHICKIYLYALHATKICLYACLVLLQPSKGSVRHILKTKNNFKLRTFTGAVFCRLCSKMFISADAQPCGNRVIKCVWNNRGLGLINSTNSPARSIKLKPITPQSLHDGYVLIAWQFK